MRYLILKLVCLEFFFKIRINHKLGSSFCTFAYYKIKIECNLSSSASTLLWGSESWPPLMWLLSAYVTFEWPSGGVEGKQRSVRDDFSTWQSIFDLNRWHLDVFIEAVFLDTFDLCWPEVQLTNARFLFIHCGGIINTLYCNYFGLLKDYYI